MIYDLMFEFSTMLIFTRILNLLKAWLLLHPRKSKKIKSYLLNLSFGWISKIGHTCLFLICG